MKSLVLVGVACFALGCSGDDESGDAGEDAPMGAADGTDGGTDGGAEASDADGGAAVAVDGTAGVTGEGSSELLALTYNVAGLPETLSSSMPERFTPQISPLLNAYELVLVQESWLTPDPNPGEPLRVYHELLIEEAEHPYQSVPAEQPWGMDERRPAALLADGLNRFSQFPFEDVVRVAWDICVDSAADCLALKGFSMARTTLADGVEVDIYNLHMEAGGTPEDDASRAAGAEQLIEFMADTSAGRAVIVGGDFNLHIEDEPDGTLFAHLLEQTGLSDVCTVLECEDPERIDKFLYRGNDALEIEPRSWSDDSGVFVSDMDEPLSDHHPVAVQFSWETR